MDLAKDHPTIDGRPATVAEIRTLLETDGPGKIIVIRNDDDGIADETPGRTIRIERSYGAKFRDCSEIETPGVAGLQLEKPGPFLDEFPIASAALISGYRLALFELAADNRRATCHAFTRPTTAAVWKLTYTRRDETGV